MPEMIRWYAALREWLCNKAILDCHGCSYGMRWNYGKTNQT